MTNVLSSALSTIETKAASAGAGAASAILSFFSSSLLTLAEDELVILNNAIAKLLAEKEAGASWEDALTAAYNTFYSAEVDEKDKIAMAFLEAISKITSAASAIL